MSLKEKLKKISSESKSDWLEEAGKKLANKGSRRNARKVALRVLQILHERGISQTELAGRMGVSRQQVTKIVKGKENFTFETIDKLEKALNITLITIGSPVEVSAFGWSSLTGVFPTQPANLIGKLGNSFEPPSTVNWHTAVKLLRLYNDLRHTHPAIAGCSGTWIPEQLAETGFSQYSMLA